MSVLVYPTFASDNNINWDQLGHDSRDPLFRSPGGAVPTGTSVRLRLRALDGDLTSAEVRVWNDRENTSTLYPLTREVRGVTLPGDATVYEFWSVTLPPSALPTVYWYRFIARDGSATAYYEDDARRTGGWGQVFAGSPDNSYQLSIYDPAFQTPDWVQNAVIYQIFPDRFRDGNSANNPTAGEFFYGNNDTIVRSNDTEWNTAICDPRSRPGAVAVCANAYSQNFYGGDLQGIIDQLDYLDSLGVTALYLNPIFESPSNHRYDTTDFMLIDPRLGTLADFQQLYLQAQARGIRLILDGVFNHSSSDSVYFDRYGRWNAAGSPTATGTFDGSGACESTASPYFDWYTFFPFTGTGPSPCSDNRDYPKWFGIFDSLPVFQHDDDEVRDYFIDNANSVARYWMQWADGWRLDVAPEVDHGTINDPNDDYWEDFRAAVRAANPDAYIVGEEWGNATSWTLGGEWDATMNYQFGAAVLSFWRDEPFVDNDFNGNSSAGVLNPLTPTGVTERLLNLQERYAPEAFAAMMNLFNSHDTNRLLFLLDHTTDSNNTFIYADPNYDWTDALARQRGAALMQLTMPGAPTIYYGDEIGLVGPVVYDGSQWQDDPYNRQPFPWLDATGSPFYAHLQSTTQRNSLFSYYQTLINTRSAVPALRTGTFDPLLTDDANGVFAYGRKMPNDSSAAIVVVNRSTGARTAVVSVAGYLPTGATLTNVLGGGTLTVDASGNLTVNVPARGGVLLTLTGFGGRPAAVTGLTATASAGQIVLNWTGTGASAYDVYRSLISGGGYGFVGTTTNTTYTDTGLANARAYHYVVVSRNTPNLLESGFSNEASGTPAFNLGSNAWYNLQWPPTINHVLSAVNPTETIYGQIYIAGATDATSGQVPNITAQVGYGPQADPPTAASWTWFPMTFNAESGNNDEYQGTLLPTQVGTFYYTTRWSADGGQTWFYTDRNGPPYETAQAGVLTVTAPSDSTPPPAPVNLRVTGTTSVSISLAWDAHPNTDGDLNRFEVWRENTASPGPSRIATVSDPTATSYTDNTVTAGQTYNYYLHALDNSLNISLRSLPVTATAEMRMVTVTLNVTVPAGTPGTVSFAGSFPPPLPSWTFVNMTQTGPTTWTYTFTALDGTVIQYKYQRGTWDAVEKGPNNEELGNRSLTVAYGTTGTQTINDTVDTWRDPYVTAFTPAANASGLPPNTVVTVTWSQSMPNPPTGFTMTGPGGAVAGTFSYDAPTRTHTFTPGVPLASGLYTVTITGTRDSENDVQLAPTTWSFSVTAPEITPEITPPVTPEVTPPVTPEVTPPVTPEVTPPVTPEVTPPVTPEVTPPVTPEVTPPVTPEVTPPVTPEVTPPVTPEVTPPVTPEVTPQVTPPVTPEVTPQVTPQATAVPATPIPATAVPPLPPSITITVTPPLAAPGSLVRWLVTVNNPGGLPLTNLVITLTFSDGVTFITITPSSGQVAGQRTWMEDLLALFAQPVHAQGAVTRTWTIPTLAAGQSATLVVEGRLPERPLGRSVDVGATMRANELSTVTMNIMPGGSVLLAQTLPATGETAPLPLWVIMLGGLSAALALALTLAARRMSRS